MNYILGQLVWRDGKWQAPDPADRFIDLRPLSAQALPGTVQGHALIATERDPVGAEVLIAGAVNESLTDQARDAVRDLLAIPEALTVQTMPELIQRLLGVYSDPGVGLICPPLIPDRRGFLNFRLGDVAYREKCPTSGTVFDNILKVLHADYRSVKESPDTPGDLHRKMLAVWKRKFGVENHEVFIPADLPKETPVRPTTTLQDNFDVGNHVDIGGQASSQGWTWGRLAASAILTAIRTDTQTWAEGVATGAGARGYYRAESDLSSTDHYVQSQVRTSVDGFTPALMARKDSSATLTYYELQLGSPSGDSLWLLKVVAGTPTVLYNPGTTVNADTFYTLKLNISGSTLQLFKDAAQVGTDQTDSSISSGLRCGLVVQGNNASTNSGGFEDFEASDGLTSTGADYYYRQMRNQ